MDKQHMTFDIDRHSVTEGDVVQIRWQCLGADRVRLTIDNGRHASTLTLEPTGTKRFRLNRSQGRTRLTIGATVDGHEHTKTHRVRVKKMRVTRAETLDHRGRPQGALRRLWRNSVTKWHTLRNRFRLAVNQLPEGKRIAFRALIILSVALLLSALWPRLYTLALLATAAYLAIVLLRR